MNNAKQLTKKPFKTFSILAAGIGFSLLLLLLRIKISQTFFYAFLVWNLFLAIVPYAVSTILNTISKPNKLLFLLYFTVWLAFLPNAPYIITDLVHLRLSGSQLIWLDILVVSAFACNGLLLFYISVEDMLGKLKHYIKQEHLKYLCPLLLFLSAFGVYLGRFLRYNSWEIIQNPKVLFYDMLEILVHPKANLEPWLFTLVFGLFLNLWFWIFKTLKNSL